MSAASGSKEKKKKGSKDVTIPVELINHLRKEIWDLHAKTGAAIPDIIAQLSKDTSKISFGNRSDARILSEIAKHLDDSDVVSLMQASHFVKDSIVPTQRSRYKEYNTLLPNLYQIANTTNFQARHRLLRALPPQRHFQSAVTQMKRMVAAPAVFVGPFVEQFDPKNYIHTILLIALRNILEIRLKLEKGEIEGIPFSQYFHEADGFNVVTGDHYINKLLFPLIETVIPNYVWSLRKVLFQLYPSCLTLQEKADEWLSSFKDNKTHPAYNHARSLGILTAKINRLIRLLIQNRLNMMLHISQEDVLNEYEANSNIDSMAVYLQLLVDWYKMAPKKYYLSQMKNALLHMNTLRAWETEEQKGFTQQVILTEFSAISGGGVRRRAQKRGG